MKKNPLKSTAKFPSKPIIFDLSRKIHLVKLNQLIKEKKLTVRDDYTEQLHELKAILALSSTDPSGTETSNLPLWQQGKWVYFPWLATVSHILNDLEYQLVRTARNRNLITEAEQKKIYNATVGIAGLSIGNSVALALTLQGGARRIRLADHDQLSLSNLNRIRAGAQHLGIPKAILTAQQIYEINPYAEIEIFEDGLTEKNIISFFKGLDIIVDEMDNLAMKYLLREQARSHRIAVVMGADNADSAVIDIERYDRNPSTQFFNGRLGNISYDQLSKLGKVETGEMIEKLIGAEHQDERMRKSLLQIGKTLVSWPQLGGTAMLNGAAVAYYVRQILTGKSVPQRSSISLK